MSILQGSGRSSDGADGGERRRSAFALPKAWSFLPSSRNSSGSGAMGGEPSNAYTRLPASDGERAGEVVSSSSRRAVAAAAAGDVEENGDDDEDDEDEARPSRPSFTSVMSSSYMSESSMTYGNDDDDDDGENKDGDEALSPLEKTRAWDECSTFQRSAVLLSFLLLGAGVLLAFNALISPTEYFRARFKGTPYQDTFSSWIITIYNIASIVFGAHATATLGRDSSGSSSSRRSLLKDAGARTQADAGLPTSHSRAAQTNKQLIIMRRSVRRIFSSGAIVVACLVILAASTGVKSAAPPKVAAGEEGSMPAQYFYVVMALSFISAAAVSYLQNAVVAICSVFGSRAMSLMLSGQGVIGLSISIVQLAAAWAQSDPAVQSQIAAALSSGDDSFENPATAAARIFFSTGAALMVVTLIGFSLLIKSQCWAEVIDASLASHSRRPSTVDGRRRQSYNDEAAGSARHPKPAPDAQAPGAMLRWISPYVSDVTRSTLARLWDVQAQTIVLCLTIAYVFTLTLAIFPALTARVQSKGYVNAVEHGGPPPARWQTPLVFAALHFLVFNLADLIGRSLPGLVPTLFLIRRGTVLVVLALSRTVLLPLLRGCNLPRPSRASPQSDGAARPQARGGASDGSILHTDAAFMLIVFTLGLSNGLLATSILIAGPSQVRPFEGRSARSGGGAVGGTATASKSATRSAQALAATVLSYWLTIGLALGSALSFLTVSF